jgi:ubiquitin carboxyl-terminal hydrolase 4/11/15
VYVECSEFVFCEDYVEMCVVFLPNVKGMFCSGSAAGHYTSYAKNPRTTEWHCFNDDIVTKQKPQEEDYSHAYVLFYQKQGELS